MARASFKVMTVVGTRPELIKLSRVISELERCVTHVLVHTGQNYDYELNGIFFRELGIRKPDHFLEAASDTPAATIGNAIAGADRVLAEEKPDAFLLLGDTNSCLAAIAAKRRKVPVFHMEAGNRCFDERVPEEINRRIVDHISDINLPYTEHARRYLLAEGLRAETIIKTGSPMREVIEFYMPKIRRSPVLRELKLKRDGYFLASAHREENVDDPGRFRDFLASLAAVRETWRLPVVVSTHPRTRKRLEESGARPVAGTRLLKPLGFFDYVKLQMNARCVISDSGTITEESSLLDFPAVTLRQAHERPEGMDEGTLIMCGVKPEGVVTAIETVLRQRRRGVRRFRIADDYLPDNVSRKVVRTILSYTDYVNRTVWRKSV
jgi:UDP-N-acetylglucosamine 2-epimerase (non-hydrolysing)